MVWCDEASDLSNKEQFSFCLKYTDENGCILNDFLKYIHYQSGLSGKNLYNEVSSALENLSLDVQNCCNQGYGEVVTGKVNDLNALFLKGSPKALYTHCPSVLVTS